jgi:hypothetical protein
MAGGMGQISAPHRFQYVLLAVDQNLLHIASPQNQ